MFENIGAFSLILETIASTKMAHWSRFLLNNNDGKKQNLHMNRKINCIFWLLAFESLKK